LAETALLADASFLVALLDRRDGYHAWAAAQGPRLPPPWKTCEAVLAEAYFLLGRAGGANLSELLYRGALLASFQFEREQAAVLQLLDKYVDVPMSFADACLVRMTELHTDSLVLTTDSDFRFYRRLGRQVVPCVTPH
jgi:predicted nucleic acid-binding protein